MARPLTAFLGLALAAVGTRASAKSCVHHAYEHMDVELVDVRQAGKVVAAPPGLRPLDQALNSGEKGRGVLFWEAKTMGFGKLYELDRVDPPTPKVLAYIESYRDRALRTECGSSVPYTPILPGRYVFSREHADGATVSRGVERPVLTVAPGRAELVLDFGVLGVRYQATYRVKCAYFDWEAGGLSERCAPSEASTGVATQLRSPSPDDAQSDAPVVIPSAQPSLPAAPAIETRSGAPTQSCGSCAIGARQPGRPGGPALFVALLGALAGARRSGRRRGRTRALTKGRCFGSDRSRKK
ncbi:MAG: hypothetical protein U0263_08305 [Polyangiaceae bacterium]